MKLRLLVYEALDLDLVANLMADSVEATLRGMCVGLGREMPEEAQRAIEVLRLNAAARFATEMEAALEDVLTEEELDALVRFYADPAGRSGARKLQSPELQARFRAVGQVMWEEVVAASAPPSGEG